ncbi:MAG TPA: dihydrodipicolinate synthase family protein [Bryobacteraceae bacterium]|jgi:dihydrodipicolinate synthase/N-acetylneuraminate lyase
MVNSKHPTPANGVYAALATPRHKHSVEADCVVLLDYLDTVMHAGVDGLVLFGATGEFVHFDIEERMRVLALAIRRSRVPVLVNVSHSTLAGALDLAENSIGAGAAGVLLMPPYFYRYTDDQLFSFYQSFVDLIGNKVPIYLYNLPFFTNPISAELAARLLESKAFAGIKDSSGEWALFETLKEIRERVPFTLLAGNESIYLRCRQAGAGGIVSGVAAAVPELVVAMDRAIRSGDCERAYRLNTRLIEFIQWTEKFPATVAIKQAAVARGWKLNHFSFRLDDDTQAELAAFHQWLGAWLPLVLAEAAEPTPAKA